MTMAAVSQRGSGYTSFPRTSPHRTFSQEEPSPAPWFDCGAERPDQPPSPVVTVHHHKRLQEKGQMHRQQQRYSNSTRRQQRPNYPTTIQFAPSQDDGAPFDEDVAKMSNITTPDDFDWGLGPTLEGASLEETFGFERNVTSDDLFEKLYTGMDGPGEKLHTLPDEEEDGTLQSSSVELNPYPAKVRSLMTKQTKQIVQNKDSLNRHRELCKTQARDSIFRSQPNAQPLQITEQRQRGVPASYERKVTENMQLISPTLAMDRRRSSKPATQARSEVASPSSSVFTSAAPIHRTNTGTSLRRNNTDAGTSSRHRSVSRSHRSRSRGTSRRRRSRSRSTSVAPKKIDEYDQSLFRGAALIREQLIRSMASADQAMDEGEREFMEEMIEVGDRQQQLRAARQARRSKNKGDNDDFDCDYSFDHSQTDGANSAAIPAIEPSPSRGSGARFTPSPCGHSQDSSALETESRRLDNLMHILNANSSMSSSNPGAGVAFQRTSSDKENNVQAPPTVDRRSNLTIQTHDIISPTSSLGLNSPAMVSPMQSTNVHNEYASRYFEEDQPKPIVVSPAVETMPSKTNPRPSDHNERRRHGAEQVDDALAHARRAGPLWRSLVGNHVRFPKKWENVLPPTTPPIHSHHHRWSKWFYLARHRVKGDKRLNSREFGVRSRRSGGRILLRVLVREMHSQQVSREIAIGCLHPNSKGIRRGDPSPEAEDVREVWMAVRWLTEDDEPSLDLRNEADDYEGVLDSFLMQMRQALDYGTMGSALGHRKAVNNENVRAVFGDQPPINTIDLHEDEIAEILKANGSKKLAVLPALMLLKLFLFSK